MYNKAQSPLEVENCTNLDPVLTSFLPLVWLWYSFKNWGLLPSILFQNSEVPSARRRAFSISYLVSSATSQVFCTKAHLQPRGIYHGAILILQGRRMEVPSPAGWAEGAGEKESEGRDSDSDKEFRVYASSPCGRRLAPKCMFQSSPCTLQLELAGLGSGPWRPASDVLRPSCLEFHGPLVPLTLYTSPAFLSALLSTFCSLPCHGLLPWCLL